jgi:hypothetical protein
MKMYSKPRKILSIGLNGQKEANGWTWNNGTVNLRISETQLMETAGFLIEF